MNEIIERLKRNKTAFGLLSPEEQECFRKAGRDNCMIYDVGPKWVSAVKANIENEYFDPTSTYAIKPDYQPEPEYIDLEIEEHESGMWLGVYSDHHGMPHHFTHVRYLPDLSNFECFWYKFQGGKVEFYTNGKVAKLRREGKVFARLREDKL